MVRQLLYGKLSEGQQYTASTLANLVRKKKTSAESKFIQRAKKKLKLYQWAYGEDGEQILRDELARKLRKKSCNLR